jgi:threonylcarbamoyladenosine tRNA methylthiotransferase MtaB
MTVQVVSLGCRLNISESEAITAMLQGGPPTVVVNSCAVTAEAVRQSRRTVRRLRRENPDARLVVTGCASTVEADAFAQMPEVDAVVPNAEKLEARHWTQRNVPPASLSQQHTRAFIAVQNGCDHACTFCVIPQGRGPSRSLAIPDVLRTVEHQLSLGVAEVVLTGVDVTSWGGDLPDDPRLGHLVAAILTAFPTLPRLRLSSLDGVEIDPVLLDLITGEPRVMPHIHLSLQSGDDMVLKRMKRRHTRAQAITLVRQIKARRPEVAIGADLIAGYPTETPEMHASNLSIVHECDVVHGHIFPYSPRPGTPAERMPQVPPAQVRARAAELRAAVSARRDAWLQTLIGTPAVVLAERDGTGHAGHFASYRTPTGAVPGSLVTCTPTRIIEGILE